MSVRKVVSIVLSCVAVSALAVLVVHAAANNPATQYIPPGQTLNVTTVVDDIVYIVDIIAGLAGLIVVGMIVWAGITMATAGGNDARYKTGKSMLVNAVIGALVIFGVGLIVNTIANFADNPDNVLQ